MDLRFSPWRKSLLTKHAFHKIIVRHNRLRSDLGFSPCKVGLWTFPVILIPLANAATMSHESPSKFLIVTKTRTTTWVPCHSPPLTSPWIIRRVQWWQHIIDLRHIPSQTKRSEKIWVCTVHNQIPSDLVTSTRVAQGPREFVGRAFQNTTL
jgi:hypothetical protein